MYEGSGFTGGRSYDTTDSDMQQMQEEVKQDQKKTAENQPKKKPFSFLPERLSEKMKAIWQSVLHTERDMMDVQFYVGEYAANMPVRGVVHRSLRAAVAEALFMIGFERNADVVTASAFAPLLNNVHGTQWHCTPRADPNLN